MGGGSDESFYSHCILFFLFFFFQFIYLAVPGISCYKHDLQSLMQHAESLVVPCGI